MRCGPERIMSVTEHNMLAVPANGAADEAAMQQPQIRRLTRF